MPSEKNCDICFENNSEREVEKFVGIKYFMTPKVKGIGGIYKYTHKDFIVKEITEDGEVLEIRDDTPPIYFSEDIDDKYTTFNLIKINKETFEAINSISNILKVPINQISYSGLKDKCSI
ncbi:MAG: tRNA pseudouridine(13) synthase TruD, partial [Promethearchaeia archaeon]